LSLSRDARRLPELGRPLTLIGLNPKIESLLLDWCAARSLRIVKSSNMRTCEERRTGYVAARLDAELVRLGRTNVYGLV